MPVRAKGWLPDLEEHISKTPSFEGIGAAQKFGSVRTPREHDALVDDCLVRDQEQTSMCVGFGLTGAIYCRLHTIGIPCKPLAPQPLYGLTRMASRINKRAKLTDDGCYPFVAQTVLSDFGVAPESAYPFNPETVNEEIDLQAIMIASQFRVSSFQRITHRGSSRVDICKRAIASGHTVPLGMMVGAEFEDYTSSKDPIGVEVGDVGGHMTFLCGYEDGGEVFIGCNSWGEDYGDHGFYRISREKLEHPSTTDLYEFVIAEK
jgi:hypothetical protein